MSKTYLEQKNAVLSGYWPLYRYNPQLVQEGKNPFVYETNDPKQNMMDFIMNEMRYTTLKLQFPEVADELYKQAVKFKEDKHEFYKKFSQI
jgi:pyruvate-ferredoxin/flavodoxin oxidoreductase